MSKALTTQDLRALAELPRVIEALKKLSAQSQELQSLLSKAALPSGGTPAAAPPQYLRANGSEAGGAPAPALSQPKRRVSPQVRGGLSERLPDFGPNAGRGPEKFATATEEVRSEPGRAEKLAQFKHDEEDDDG